MNPPKIVIKHESSEKVVDFKKRPNLKTQVERYREKIQQMELSRGFRIESELIESNDKEKSLEHYFDKLYRGSINNKGTSSNEEKQDKTTQTKLK